MNSNIRTIALSISLALATGAFMATHALASEFGSDTKIAATLSGSTPGNFGDMDMHSVTIINDESRGIDAIANFFGPDQKRVLVRTYAEYDAIKQIALRVGVTTPERIAMTEVVVVPEYAAMFGIRNIEQYAIDQKLVQIGDKSKGTLTYNDKVITAAFHSITMRAKAGELLPVTDTSFQELS